MCARHVGPPALPPVDHPLPLKQFVGGRHGSARDGQVRGENPLGRKPCSREKCLPLDRGPKRRRQPPVQRPAASPPAAQGTAQSQRQGRAKLAVIGLLHWSYSGRDASTGPAHPPLLRPVPSTRNQPASCESTAHWLRPG